MSDISVYDAKNRLSALLDEVEGGGEVTITRRGKPVARLVPVHTASATRLAETLRACRAALAADAMRFTREEIKAFITEGRP